LKKKRRKERDAENSDFTWCLDNCLALGRAYMKQGAREQAICCLKKSLELNPGNKNVEMMLKMLEEKK